MLLGFSRQSYYQGINFIHKKAFQDDLILHEVIRYRKVQKRIGTRKLFEEMKDFLSAHHFQIGRDAFFDLLSKNDLLIAKRKPRAQITTLSKHRFRMYPNIIREFIPTAPNQLWVSDITYIILSNKFAYLSLITDAYSRKIVGFSLCKDLSTKGPLKALKMALKANQNTDSLIHHSDRGVQYCSDAYVKILKDKDIKISMTEKGDPLENAIAERVNGILKSELLDKKFANFEQAQQKIAIACSTYNYLRPHGSINNLKPAHAHQTSGEIKKRWKNYWRPKKEMEENMA